MRDKIKWCIYFVFAPLSGDREKNVRRDYNGYNGTVGEKIKTIFGRGHCSYNVKRFLRSLSTIIYERQRRKRKKPNFTDCGVLDG